MSCKHAQTPLVSACVWVLSGFFFVCIAVRKVKDSAARKLNRGQKRKLSGRSRAREERSEKNHHFLFRPWSSLCEAVPLTLRTTKQNNQKTPATQATCVIVQLLVADREVRDQAVTLFHEQVSAPREVGEVLQGIVGWGVPPGPANPDPILDQKNNAIFLSFTFGIDTTNAFIHSRSSLHTRFQTKMGKVYTRFQTQTAQKLYPFGRHIPIGLI